MRNTSLLITAAALLAGVSATHATLFAYEGFDAPVLTALPSMAAPNGTALNAVNASGTGWQGAWTVSNGNSTDSVFQSAGLSYPASYTGSFTAVGGNGLNKANTANSALRLNLDAAVATAVNSEPVIFVSFLGMRQGPTTPDQGLDGTAAVGTYANNPYPRPAGARLMNAATLNNNGSMGNVQWSGSTTAGIYDPNETGWGAWGWKDTHGLMSGAGTAEIVDFVVVKINRTNQAVTFWVNPQSDLTSDGYASFHYTDGTNIVNMNLFAFGIEAGSGNAQRAPGEWVFDEIRIASSFQEAAGMVPEPSTYAAILGLMAIGFAFLRRRKN